MRLGGQYNGDNRVQLNCMRFYERPFVTREEIRLVLSSCLTDAWIQVKLRSMD